MDSLKQQDPSTSSVSRIPAGRTLLPFALAVLLTGCAGVLESNKPAREVYLLKPPESGSAAAASDAPRLVMSLVAVPGLDTDDIQVLGSDAKLTPVANAHWPDNLPEVIGSLTRRSLIDSGMFHHVANGTLARPGTWQLELELQAFYGLQDSSGSASRVLMKMDGNLRCSEGSQTIRLEDLQSVRAASLAALVAAHQQALDNVLRSLRSQVEMGCAGSGSSSG